jgi:hypothetical protein
MGEPCGLWQAKHNVHALDSLPGGTFPEIILHHEYYEKITFWWPVNCDSHEI